ncbi:hypothetical protein HYY69_00050 [Candidatus Woesearchaeota archaeon]|nr:hypothetical protein [Candidatus Woesearchaeota archaeon]
MEEKTERKYSLNALVFVATLTALAGAQANNVYVHSKHKPVAEHVTTSQHTATYEPRRNPFEKCAWKVIDDYAGKDNLKLRNGLYACRVKRALDYLILK